MMHLCLVECYTWDYQNCVFPFYYNGTQHYGCVKEGNSVQGWCATEVTQERITKYGYCNYYACT